MTEDLQLFIMIASILIVPKILLRFRFPGGITALFIGLAAGIGLDWYENSQTLYILATLGITSLFLFAGMEVELPVLKKNYKFLIKNILLSLVLLIISAFVIETFLKLGQRASLILALGLTTPSTGFILNSINVYKFDDKVKFWVSNSAIAAEIVAILILFFTLQSDSISKLATSSLTIVGMLLVVPYLFSIFLKKIAPFAPDSEVSFLVLVAFLCGIITRKIGTYYLVGAFIVGMVASQFRHFDGNNKSEKMLYSVEFFFSFFVPFYFFQAGVTISEMTFSWTGVTYGLTFIALFLPLRMFTTNFSIRMFLDKAESVAQSHQAISNISIALLPTLIFGIVIALILQENFNVSSEITIGLIIYTIVSSIIPAVMLEKAPPEEYDATSHFHI